MLSLELQSLQPSEDIKQRRMKHITGNGGLAYNLFTNSAMTSIWGNGRQVPAPVVRVQGRKTGMIFGNIYPGQDVPIGEYLDTIRLTILP